MIHLLNESHDLSVYPIPDGVRAHLQKVLDAYEKSGRDRSIKGYKRLNNLLSMKNGVYERELKRIKNFFDNYKGDKDSVEYILNGGDVMRSWVETTLYTERKAEKDFKQAKKEGGINNAYIKNHHKEKGLKTTKPTHPSIETNGIGTDSAVRFK